MTRLTYFLLGMFRASKAILVGLSLLTLGTQVAMSACFDNIGVPRSTSTQDFELLAGNSVALHKKTGLMWRRCPVGFRVDEVNNECDRIRDLTVRFTWQGALKTSIRRNFSTLSGWRLPSIKELQSIIEYACLPLLDPAVFPSIAQAGAKHFWSSSPAESSNAVPRAYQMDFDFGGITSPNIADENFVFLVRDTNADFATTMAPAFEHPRCQNCHAVAATNFVSGGDANGVGLPVGHTPVSVTTPNATCEGCHTSSLQPPGAIDPGWHEAPLSNDLRNLSVSELCERATEVPGSATSAHNHLTEDRLILWAFKPERPFDGTFFEAAPPFSVEAWRDVVDLWRDLGQPCPTE